MQGYGTVKWETAPILQVCFEKKLGWRVRWPLNGGAGFAAGARAVCYLPQRQSDPHLQSMQVQVALQRSFWFWSVMVFSLVDHAGIGARRDAGLNGRAKVHRVSHSLVRVVAGRPKVRLKIRLKCAESENPASCAASVSDAPSA